MWLIDYVFVLWFFKICDFLSYFSIFSVEHFNFYTSLLLILIFVLEFVFEFLLDSVIVFLEGERECEFCAKFYFYFDFYFYTDGLKVF